MSKITKRQNISFKKSESIQFAAFTTKYSLTQEDKAKCMVEELMEVLPFTSQDTVGLLVKVLEAIPREVFSKKVLKLLYVDFEILFK